MKFIRGKRQFKDEKLYGFVRYYSPRLKLHSFMFVWGQRAWGWQWAK